MVPDSERNGTVPLESTETVPAKEKRLRLDKEDCFLLLRGIDKVLQSTDKKTWLGHGQDAYNVHEKLRGLARALHDNTTGRRSRWAWHLPELKEIHGWVLEGLRERRKLARD